MRLATALAIRGPLEDVFEQARVVDALGYDSVWVPEIAGRDALVTCAALAPQLERAGLATGIVPLPVRSPATLAMGAAALSEITGGRFVLGVGAGHPQTLREWFGVAKRERVADLGRTLTTLRAILHDGGVHTDGLDFRLRGVHPPSPPAIVLAALRPKMAALAGRAADGVVLNWMTPAAARDVIAHVRAAATRSGRDPDSLEYACFVPACVTDDTGAARAELGRQMDVYGRLDAYADLIGSCDADSLGAHGDADAVRARLAEYVEAGVTLPILVPYPVGEDPWASMTQTWASLAPG